MKTSALLFSLLLLLTSVACSSTKVGRELSSVKHARELLGGRYKKSIVSSFEKHMGLEKTILDSVTLGLPKKDKHLAEVVTEAILGESNLHGLDPYFVMAVISGESSFNPSAVGSVGEIGLMQIRPATGKWIAEKYKIEYRGKKTLKDPIANIKLGTAYFAWLREKFDNHSQLYLAAYNMGPKSVKSAMGRKKWPKDYPIHVMKRYIAYYEGL